MKASVVVKIGDGWFIGYLEGLVFTKNKQIKRLADVKDVSSYVTLKKYLKDQKKDPLLESVILNETKLKKIYVLDIPAYCSEKEFDDYYWGKFADKCMKCSNLCKQSGIVKLHYCPDFKEMEKGKQEKIGG